jgi:serine/threonine-protein kinase
MIEKLKSKYDIIRKVGSGGMAEIFLAKDKSNNELVAIKILNSERSIEESSKRRFLSEMKLTKNINSDYVIEIYDYKYNNDLQYLVMEYIDGQILKDYVQKRSYLTVDEAVNFSKQIALGLIDIHKAKIIHRDIKASNILVYGHGQIKIIDLGIALNDESDRLTKTNTVIGSPQYLGPELLEGAEPTKKLDIYSLGILIYEMLTGTLPYSDPDPLKTILKHKTSKMTPVNKVNESVPQSLANIVIKATAKNPKKRYKDMNDFYNDLNTCLSNERINEKVLDLSNKKAKGFFEIINSTSFLITTISIFVFLISISIILLLVL